MVVKYIWEYLAYKTCTCVCIHVYWTTGFFPHFSTHSESLKWPNSFPITCPGLVWRWLHAAQSAETKSGGHISIRKKLKYSRRRASSPSCVEFLLLRSDTPVWCCHTCWTWIWASLSSVKTAQEVDFQTAKLKIKKKRQIREYLWILTGSLGTVWGAVLFYFTAQSRLFREKHKLILLLCGSVVMDEWVRVSIPSELPKNWCTHDTQGTLNKRLHHIHHASDHFMFLCLEEEQACRLVLSLQCSTCWPSLHWKYQHNNVERLSNTFLFHEIS